MKIAITAESTIDLPKELLEKYSISTIPFNVILGENEFKDGEITSSDIFDFVTKNNELPKTSAINTEDYSTFFKSKLKDNDALIHFSLSSKISSSCSNSITASKNFKNVFVVDTLSLSTGIALLAIKARTLADEGLDVEEIYKQVCELVPKVQASFVVERLDYLYKGGRCSALALFGANLLKIRPQIIVKNGSMNSYKKYRGKMDNVISNYCNDTLNEFNSPNLDVAFVTYTTATEQMAKTAKEALQKRGFKNIYETRAGGTITSHCGEHTLGILYINGTPIE